jgi:hypothetical protein
MRRSSVFISHSSLDCLPWASYKVHALRDWFGRSVIATLSATLQMPAMSAGEARAGRSLGAPTAAATERDEPALVACDPC